MKKNQAVALLVALVFYATQLPWPIATANAEYFNLQGHDVTSDGGNISGFSQVGDNNTTLYGNDLITKGPWVDVRAFGAVPNAGASVDQWSAFDNAIQYCNINKKALYVPPGRYYVSAPIDLSSNGTGTGYTSTTMYSDRFDFADLLSGAVISPHSTFTGGTAGAPANLVIVDRGRGTQLINISLVGNYHTDGKYISAIGIKNQTSRTNIINLNIFDFYIGISVAYGGNQNNDMTIIDSTYISNVGYGIVNSGNQTYGTRVQNTGIVADNVCYDDSGLLGLSGGGDWSFSNVTFSFGKVGGPKSYGVKSTATNGALTFDKCHWEPEAQPYMPYFIYAGGSSVGTINITGAFFNLGGVVASIDNTDHPSFYFRGGVVNIKNSFWTSNSNIIMDAALWGVPANGRLVFDTCSFHIAGAGKTFTPPEDATFILTTYINDVDNINKIYNDLGFYSRVYSESRTIGWGDYITSWPSVHTPASDWLNGSMILKSTPAVTGNASQLGWQKISGAMQKVYITTTPVMTSAPADNTTACTAGTLAWDTSYVYVCTTDNNWKRSALSTY